MYAMKFSYFILFYSVFLKAIPFEGEKREGFEITYRPPKGWKGEVKLKKAFWNVYDYCKVIVSTDFFFPLFKF